MRRVTGLAVLLAVLVSGLAQAQLIHEDGEQTDLCAALQSSTDPATYQGQRIQKALVDEKLEVEPSPEGKSIAFVRFVRRDVFAEDEPWPTFFNRFHWLTRERIVTQEMLVFEGETFDCAPVYETTRNLRSLGIFSLVALVPVKATEGRVGLLVFTRDLWSLRFEQAFQTTGSVIDQLLLQLTERNLFGLNQRATVRYQLFPDRFSVGEVFIDRRLGGAPLRLVQSGDVIFNRDSQEAEGFTGTLNFGRPLYNLAQPWGFEVDGFLDVRIRRQLRAGEVGTYDRPSTEETEAIPRVWDQRVFSASTSAFLQRSQWGRYRHRLTAGLSFARVEAETNDETGDLSEDALAEFESDVLPQRLTRVAPFVSWRFFRITFRAVEDLATFGQSEDIQTGPSLALGLSAPLEALGSDQRSLFMSAAADWTYVSRRGGIIEGGVGVEGRQEGGELINQLLAVGARGATPHSGFGRLIGRVTWATRVRDRNNTLVTLGGDNGLRGYPSQHLFGFGESRFRANTEWRTRPWVLASVHIGAAAFYDTGAIYAEREDFELTHAVGGGLRVLFPQFNRDVYRIDFGVPLDGSGFSVLIGTGSSQAVPLTAREDAL